MKKRVFPLVSGILSGALALVFIVLLGASYGRRGEYYVGFDLQAALCALAALVPASILGTAALVCSDNPVPLYIASGAFALLTVPAWLNIAAMSFVTGLPMLLCLSCTLSGALLTKCRPKPLFICSGAVFAAYFVIALIAVASTGHITGESLLSVCMIFFIPAVDSASFGLSAGLYLLGKPLSLFIAAGVLAGLSVVPFFMLGDLGVVLCVPTVLCAAVCAALGIISKKERAK